MSPKNPRLTVGLTALGMFGTAAILAVGASDPVAPTGQPPVAESAPESAPSSSPTPTAATTTVLLMYNGRLIQGQGPITREGDEYVLRQRGGVIRFPERQVEGAFGSIAELYRFKTEQIPEGDPDEHLKLARWCLTLGLKDEARAELNTVVAISPDSVEANAMLASLNAESIRIAAAPRRDPGVVQTSGEAATMGQAADRPAELDSTLLRAARKELGVTGLPVIFDLPQALAVKRADQYARVVHPVLQTSCVRCHNEKHEGAFRLVQVKSRRDWSPVVFRANLDATLQFIDPENPGKSDLLSSSLLPHGNGPERRPVFRGTNDPRFQILSAWVNSLKSTSKSDAVDPTRFGGGRESGGGFATDRGEGTPSLAPGAGSPAAMLTPNPVKAYEFAPPDQLPATRFIPGKGAVVDDQSAPASEFPVPFAAGGQPPALPTAAQAPPGLTPNVETIPMPPPPGAPGTATTAEAGPPEIPTGAPKRIIKVDPKLLERALLNRNQGR